MQLQNPEDCRQLEDNDPVMYRKGRAGRNKVHWSEWAYGTLYVKKREFPLSERLYARAKNVGDVIILVVRENIGWAEYSQDDLQDGTFTCEDFYLEIKLL